MCVAELLVVRASGHLLDSQRQYPEWEMENRDLERLLAEGVGGVILFGGCTTELQERCKTLKSWAKGPLLLCADVEEGVGQRFQGGSWLMPPLAVGKIYKRFPEKAIELAERYGASTGSQARRCGLNWVLAPVCDINSNPKNPVINMRAWGEDPVQVAVLISAFIRGISSQGVLTCAKHFPGHGDSLVDSHLELPILSHDLKRLEEEELLPFKAAIASGIDSVMSGHVLLPKIDPNYPATLSSTILNILRHKIGFDGVLVTDALIMNAISNSFGSCEAAVMAFAAGADLLLMPKDPDEAIRAICEALMNGLLPMKRLEEALIRKRKVVAKIEAFDLTIGERLDNNQSHQIEFDIDRNLAKELICNSIETHNYVASGVNKGGINLLRVDGVLPCPFLNTLSPALCLPERAGYQPIICHKHGINPWREDLNEPLALDIFGEGSFFLQLFIRGNPFQGGLKHQEPWPEVISQLQRHNRLSGLVVYGSPYLWDELIKVLDPSIPSAYSPGQMPDAQKHALSYFFQLNEKNKDLKNKKVFEFTD